MISRAIAPLAFGLLLLVAWQAIVTVGHIPEYLLPAPTAILQPSTATSSCNSR